MPYVSPYARRAAAIARADKLAAFARGFAFGCAMLAALGMACAMLGKAGAPAAAAAPAYFGAAWLAALASGCLAIAAAHYRKLGNRR